MRKIILPLFAIFCANITFAENAGKIIDTQGKVFQNKNGKVMSKAFKAGESIPSHNHEGEDIIFTVLQGSLNVMLNDSEEYVIKAGQVLIFDGKNHISAEATEDSTIMVTLIKQS